MNPSATSTRFHERPGRIEQEVTEETEKGPDGVESVRRILPPFPLLSPVQIEHARDSSQPEAGSIRASEYMLSRARGPCYGYLPEED